jgi:hypothetical protein
MDTTKIKLTLGILCGVLLLPLSASASAAVQLDETAVLFTIDFSFTDELYELSVPLLAEAGVTYLDRVDTVGFTLNSDDNEVATVASLVLADQPLVGDRYQLTTGQTGNFTLLIVATFTEPIETDVSATITKLPYWLNDRRTTVHQNQLDELATPTLEVD